MTSAVWGGEHELLIPDEDESDPELSIVIPALNEELTISDFVAWCREGLAEAGVRGRDPDRRLLDGRAPPSSRAPPARACCACPSAGSGAPTWTRSRTSAAAGC